ncbi:MAG: cytidine/deoxycytidylate deaminase family protein [Candidatus Woesearchaeota archaeon]
MGSDDGRPSWDEYFIRISREVAQRATCDRGKSGCVIVRNKRIISTGYVGAPSGLPHCDEAGHLMKGVINDDGSTSMHCVRTTHAEANAIAQAAKYGVSVDGATLYCKMEPCLDCCKLLINAGIKKVVCEKKYHSAQVTRDYFKKAGVELVVLNDEVEQYPSQR